ncbi:MAG: DUF4981 domain-containing protein, partial [Oscillospiraceae bacterium]|nr:DUF4981 domain-containing protein [Oscillospiraceae bacterium]
VRVSMGKSPDSFIISSLLRFIDAGEYLDCRWEITYDGGKCAEGSLSFTVPPMGTAHITIPEAAGRSDSDTYIRFIFTAKNGYSCFENGEEVCFDQIKISTAEKKPYPVTDKAPATTVTPLVYTVTAGDISYSFNRRTAQFDKICVNGEDILAAPMQYNFFRAPVDNDTMKGYLYRAHLDDYIIKVYETDLSAEGGCVVIRTKQSFGWSIYQPFARLQAEYRINGDGAMEISCSADFSNKVEFLPRFGIRLFVPKSFSTVDYFGYGIYESYSDKHQASYIGNFRSDISDMHEDYIRPQENGSHWDCTRMSVTGGDVALTFTAPDSFSFSASEYTQEELARKAHNFELEKCENNVICADFAMAGVGSAACGPALAAEYRLPLPHVEGRLRMIPQKNIL